MEALDKHERQPAGRQQRGTDELVLTDDLSGASGLAFMNSLRGWLDARLH